MCLLLRGTACDQSIQREIGQSKTISEFLYWNTGCQNLPKSMQLVRRDLSRSPRHRRGEPRCLGARTPQAAFLARHAGARHEAAHA